MKISLFDSTNKVDTAVTNAHRAKEAGLVRYWVPQIMNADPVAVLAVVGREVQDIKLGTSVIAMQSTLPQMLAQQSLTLNQISGGRFTLGLGTNHEPVTTGVFGLPWGKPYTHMVEYLDALLPLLTEQSVSTNGTYVSHHTAIDVEADAPDVMLAALGPKMLRLAAERTSGTITWMTGPVTIAEHIRPTIGPDVDIVAGVAIWVTDDVEAALAEANVGLAIYGQLPSYRAMLDREGVTNPGEMVLIGDAETVIAGLESYKRAGATEAALSIMGEPAGAWEIIETLGGAL